MGNHRCVSLSRNRLTHIRERFFARVRKSRGCWLWTGAIHPEGYGVFSYYKRELGTYLVHRVAYVWAKGAIQPGLQIDHLCRNRRCVNPDHLEAVTPRENTLRGIGLQAQNARKTHCPNGHPLSGANLVRHQIKRWRRQCNTCKNARIREMRSRGLWRVA